MPAASSNRKGMPYAMLFLIYLPLFALLLPTTKWELITLVLFDCFLCVIFCKKRYKLAFQPLQHPFSALFLSAGLALAFYFRWQGVQMLHTVTQKVGIPTIPFLTVVAGLLCLSAVWGIDRLLALAMSSQSPESNYPAEKDSDTLSCKISGKEYVFLVLLAIIVSMQFLLNPALHTVPTTDSAVFLYIGKMMHSGLVPYRDLFDHKGPFLYLIQYLGQFFNPGGSLGFGVWLLEMANIFAFLIVSLKITKLLQVSNLSQYATVCIVPLYCAGFIYQGGNFTEEYALPWSGLAFLIFLKYFMTQSYRIRDIILLGISFSLVFLLRENLIAVWLAFMPIIFFDFVIHKKFADLGKCVITFLFGCVIIFLPLLVYCLLTDSLKACIEYYFVFNFSYSDTSTWWYRILMMVVLSFCARLSVFAIFAIFPRFKTKKEYLLSLYYYLVSALLMCMSGNYCPHYAMILLPSTVVFVALLAEQVLQISALKESHKVQSYQLHPSKLFRDLLVGSFLYVLPCIILGVSIPRKLTAVEQYLLENTQETDNVLIVGNDCLKYLTTNRHTENRFFFQLPPIKISNTLYDEFLDQFDLNYPDTVCVPTEYIENCPEDQRNIKQFCDYLKMLEQQEVYTYQKYDTYGIYTRVTFD